MNILLEPVRREFALTDIQLGLLSGLSFAIVYATLGVPAAVWAVRHDRRNLVAGAAALWGVTTVLCGAAQSFWQLLLARVGVGIGEAGGPAPSHAIVSDLYPPNERATALSILTLGINVGVILAFLVGGIVAQRWGWRTAFVMAGLLTIAAAILLRFTVRDPRRLSVEDTASASGSPVKTTLGLIRNDPVLLQVFIGATLMSVFAYTFLTWAPSLLIRSHGLSIAMTGIYLSAAIGVGGAIGTYAGGRLADALGQRDIRWSLWLIAVIFVAITPFLVAFCLLNNTVLALTLFVVPATLSAIYFGPSVAVIHGRVPAHLRPVASALFILIVTLIGLGLGPIAAGALSQHVFASYGADSLRYALVVMQFTALWGALHYYFAGHSLKTAPVAA
jgi:predicted MFS family arabinose efflux permease